jgi:hypothetical protein
MTGLEAFRMIALLVAFILALLAGWMTERHAMLISYALAAFVLVFLVDAVNAVN